MIPSSNIEATSSYAVSSTVSVIPPSPYYANGVEVGYTAPAKWWNGLFNMLTNRAIQGKEDSTAIITEINNVLSASGITPATATTNQLLSALTLLCVKYASKPIRANSVAINANFLNCKYNKSYTNFKKGTIYTGLSNCYSVCSDGRYIYVGGNTGVKAYCKSDNSLAYEYPSATLGHVHDVCFDGKYIYCASNENNVVYQLSTVDNVYKKSDTSNGIVGHVDVGMGPEGICTDCNGHVFVTNGGSSTVSVINTETMTVTNTVTVGTQPTGICYNNDSVIVANYGSNSITYISTSDYSTTSEGISSDGPCRLCIIKNYLAIVCLSSNTLIIKKGSTSISYTTENGPINICSDGKYLYVASHNLNTVSVIDPVNGLLQRTLTVKINPNSICFDNCGIYIACDNGVVKCEYSEDYYHSVEYTSMSAKQHNMERVPLIAYSLGIPSRKSEFNKLVGILVGTNPRGCCYDGSYVYVCNQGSGTVSVINPSTLTVTATITVGTSPQGCCYDGSYVYVCNGGSNGTVSVINPSTLTVTATITVGSYPFSCCYDGSYVYVCNNGGSNGTVSVINPSTLTVTATITIESHPFSCCYDGSYVYVCNSNGTVSVINTATLTVTATITVGTNHRGCCYDGSYVYVCNCESNGTVSVINPSTLTVTATITVGSYPFSCCYDGSYVYVCNSNSSGSNGTVSVINPSTLTVTATITIESYPFSCCYDGSYVYVCNSNGTVSVINKQ